MPLLSHNNSLEIPTHAFLHWQRQPRVEVLLAPGRMGRVCAAELDAVNQNKT